MRSMGGAYPGLRPFTVPRAPDFRYPVVMRLFSLLFPACAVALLSGGCSPQPAPSGGADSGAAAADGADGGDPGDGADGADGADGTGDSGEPLSPCPPDMAPVPTEAPRFCIDRFEGSEVEGLVESVAGALPLVGVTFDDARALCASTPAVAEDGTDLGTKRLASLNEWQEAAGSGLFPTGDAWPEVGTCATLTADGERTVDELQPTGSHPDCVSPNGIYDQLGNAWEWTDPDLTLDPARFFEAQAARGVSLSLDGDRIRVLEGDVGSFDLEIAGLQGRVEEEDGLLVASGVTFQAEEPFDYNGYLIHRASETDAHADWLLPVVVLREGGVETADTAPLRMRPEEDGQPVTAKVGCAWYTGTAAGCRTFDRFFGHPHDFDGSIGLRCAVSL